MGDHLVSYVDFKFKFENLTIIDIEEKDPWGRTALHFAAGRNNLSWVKKLLSRGANVAATDKYNKTPLHKAAEKNINDSHYEVAEILLKKRADVNARDNLDQTPFWYVVQRGNLKIVQLFFNFRVDSHEINYFGENLLFPAVEWNNENPKVLQLLVFRGLDVNHRDQIGNTALYIAAQKNKVNDYLNVAEILLKAGADPNVRPKELGQHLGSSPPLRILVWRANFEIIKLFIDFNADFNAEQYNKETFLSLAASSNNVEVVQLFIDLGLNVKNRNEDGKTPLHLACERNDEYVKIVKCLLKHGADINAVDKNGDTPLVETKSFWYSNTSVEMIKKNFNFVIEQTNFSEYTLNTKEPREKLWYDTILEHIAKLQSLDYPVQKDFLDRISEHCHLKNYHNECENELLQAKKTKLEHSWITYYNLLVGSRKKLKNYAGNEDLIQDFEDCVKLFPIYGASMDENMKKGMKRRELFDRSTLKLSDCLPIFNANHLIIRNTLDCILSKKDLFKFCE